MDEVLYGLPFVFAYIDDILITSGDITTHKQYLHKVLQWLSHYSSQLNLDKCMFSSTHIDFLGHHTYTNGIALLLEKITSIQDFPVPVSMKQLQHFIGMVNFY